MNIQIGSLDDPQVIDLIREHLAAMEPTAPAESRHALDLSGLSDDSITLWSIWDGNQLAGIAALKRLSPKHAEIKSMKTAKSFLRKGIASQLLSHIIEEAKQSGYQQLSLETGSMNFFAPARNLYSSFGFLECGPFEGYVEDPNSVFMTKYFDDECP